MFLKRTFLAGCAVASLSACKSDISDVSDMELLSLVGNGKDPAQITARTRECAEILGGINRAVYKDMPEEMIGIVKTDCRKLLKGWLEDSDRNSTELTLEDFDREDLAKRILSLSDAQQAVLAKQRDEARAAKIGKLKAELIEVTAAGQKLHSDLKERREALVPACDTLRGLREELKEKNRVHSLFSRGLPMLCTGDPLGRELGQIESFEERVNRFELPTTEKNFISAVPPVPRIDLDEIDTEIKRVEEVTTEYRAALASL